MVANIMDRIDISEGIDDDHGDFVPAIYQNGILKAKIGCIYEYEDGAMELDDFDGRTVMTLIPEKLGIYRAYGLGYEGEVWYDSHAKKFCRTSYDDTSIFYTKQTTATVGEIAYVLRYEDETAEFLRKYSDRAVEEEAVAPASPPVEIERQPPEKKEEPVNPDYDLTVHGFLAAGAKIAALLVAACLLLSMWVYIGNRLHWM